MSIFKNKHLLTAAIVAPILAILSYYALDSVLSEPPKPAEEGQSYQLVEKPNCRRSGGACGLKNGDFELDIRAGEQPDKRLLLTLKSVFPLEGVLLAHLETGGVEKAPVEMLAIGEGGLIWALDLPQADPEHDRLRLVASAQGALYFGDVSMRFVQAAVSPN